MFFSNMIGVDLGTDTLKLRDRSGEKFMENRGDADLTDFYLIYEDGKTADNIKNELKG